MFESEFDYTLERENMEKVRTNVAQRWGDRWVLIWTDGTWLDTDLHFWSSMLSGTLAADDHLPPLTHGSAKLSPRCHHSKDLPRALYQKSPLYGTLDSTPVLVEDLADRLQVWSITKLYWDHMGPSIQDLHMRLQIYIYIYSHSQTHRSSRPRQICTCATNCDYMYYCMLGAAVCYKYSHINTHISIY